MVYAIVGYSRLDARVETDDARIETMQSFSRIPVLRRCNCWIPVFDGWPVL